MSNADSFTVVTVKEETILEGKLLQLEFCDWCKTAESTNSN